VTGTTPPSTTNAGKTKSQNGEFFLHSKQKRELRANLVQRAWFGTEKYSQEKITNLERLAKKKNELDIDSIFYCRNPQNTMGTITFLLNHL